MVCFVFFSVLNVLAGPLCGFVVCSVGVLVIGYHLASLASWVVFLPRLCWRFPKVCGMM